MTAIARRTLLAVAGVFAATGAGALLGRVNVEPDFHRVGSKSAGSATPAGPPRPSGSPRGPSTAATHQLSAALDRERSLLASIDARIVADPAAAGALANIRSDHVAHAVAIAATLHVSAGVSVAPTGPSTQTSASPDAIPAPTVAALAAAESAAQQAGAAASAVLSGADAVLIASVSACEAGHAALLS